MQERSAASSASSMSLHEISRTKKMVSCNVKAIENRIRYFQQEESKIWRDLEEVRRQAATIEQGRSRILDKRQADHAINVERDFHLRQNRAKVANQRSTADNRRRAQSQCMQEKKIAGEEQRKKSQEFMRQKRMQDAQTRLSNSERAVQIQREQLEAKLKANQERAAKLDRLRIEHATEKQAVEAELLAEESKLPDLEAQELVCLQRLQNSRMVTQSVLTELESSLGNRNAMALLLRQKQREHLGFDQAHLLEEEEVGEEDPYPANSSCPPNFEANIRLEV